MKNQYIFLRTFKILVAITFVIVMATYNANIIWKFYQLKIALMKTRESARLCADAFKLQYVDHDCNSAIGFYLDSIKKDPKCSPLNYIQLYTIYFAHHQFQKAYYIQKEGMKYFPNRSEISNLSGKNTHN